MSNGHVAGCRCESCDQRRMDAGFRGAEIGLVTFEAYKEPDGIRWFGSTPVPSAIATFGGAAGGGKTGLMFGLDTEEDDEQRPETD